jgi:hypothetical protein
LKEMKHIKLLIPLLLIAFVLAACSPAAVPGSQTPVVSEPMPQTGEVPAAVEAARQALAESLAVDLESIAIVDYQQVDWSDGCLGLGGPAESCLAAITPGYAVTLDVGGQRYIFRTNLDGTAVREEVAQPEPAAVEAARRALSENRGIALEAISVVDFQQVDWSDSCLGLGGPAESCLAAITPGYAVILEADGQQYGFRTNLDGTAVREDPFRPESGAVELARFALAERLGVTINDVTALSQVPVEWPDGCLGLPAEDELCAMMIVPGYEITLQVEDQLYVYRTNEDGSQVREATNQVPPLEAMRDILAQRTGLSLSGIEPVSEEQVEWNNACLGISLPDVMCAEVITPGYRLVYNVDGEEMVIHTNLDLSAFVVASAPVPAAEDAVIVWEERDGGCSTVVVDKVIGYGACEGELMLALLSSSDRAQALALFVETFESFEVDTEAGSVTFRGQGEQEASEVEQRAIAEWARQAFIEAREGKSEPPADQVMEWNREGGIAGFCDTLTVYASGFAAAENCKGDAPLGIVLLSPEELEQLYDWRENLMSAEVEEKDAAVADAMTIRLSFNGNGLTAVTEQDQQEMLRLVNVLFNRITQVQ